MKQFMRLVDLFTWSLNCFILVTALLNVIFGISCVNINEDDENTCSRDGDSIICRGKNIFRPRYILYDVNPPEGFNLRRDVYIRIAVFTRNLAERSDEDWHLVLPPWFNLYHWDQRYSAGPLPWSTFFDIPSLQKFSPVIEMNQFFQETGSSVVDIVYILQRYPDLFTSGDWSDKWTFTDCEETRYKLLKNNNYSGQFWGYKNVTAKEVRCVLFQGPADMLSEILETTDARRVMFDYAEIALHDRFGDKTYWQCRRSLRFAQHLVDFATEFRQKYLNSDDVSDGILRPKDWTKEKSQRRAVGGPYLCVHLRRKDFLWGRPSDVPSLEGAASQIRQKLLSLDLDTVFVATDAPVHELEKLESLLYEFDVISYRSTAEERIAFKDGGVAIIDQIICSYARYFIGTHESTFSFRIEEEREIMGFRESTTFNRFCCDRQDKCAPPSKWKIVYD